MIEPPGHPTAQFLGFAILTELIETLVAKGVFTESDKTALFTRVSDGISKLARADSEYAQVFLRERVIPQK